MPETVECPYCWADVGEHCVNRWINEYKWPDPFGIILRRANAPFVHLARIDAAARSREGMR